MATNADYVSNIPLHEFNRQVPPGWRPNMPSYPFRLYMTRMALWYRITTLTATEQGAIVATIQQGTPFNIATTLILTRQDGTVLVGDDALCAAADGTTGDEAGLHVLLRRLRAEYKSHDQDYSSMVLDTLFDVRRGNRSLQTYMVELTTAFEDAQTRNQLTLNNIGMSHL